MKRKTCHFISYYITHHVILAVCFFNSFTAFLFNMRPSICLLLVATFCGAAISQAVNYRLDTNILPSNYEINLTPYITPDAGAKLFTFDGQSTITFTTLIEQSTIVLHAKYLSIQKITLTEFGGVLTPIFINSQNHDNVTDKLTLNLESDIVPDITYKLEFQYTGTLQTDMTGFYRSSYVENGETR